MTSPAEHVEKAVQNVSYSVMFGIVLGMAVATGGALGLTAWAFSSGCVDASCVCWQVTTFTCRLFIYPYFLLLSPLSSNLGVYWGYVWVCVGLHMCSRASCSCFALLGWVRAWLAGTYS